MLANQIYFDHGATTPVHPRVIEAMVPFWNESYGNPSSFHRTGMVAARAVEMARETAAELLGTNTECIVFTSCATESNNLALRGAMMAARIAGRGNHLITGMIEHSAVLETARQLRDLYGFELTVVPVDEFGRVSLTDIEAALRPDTVMISIMAASNEIGTMQPWNEIGLLARSRGILFHTDAVQAVATRRWDLTIDPIDMMTIAPHKFYGPKGVGILVDRSAAGLIPNQTGGGHESGLRAGTLNVPLIVGAVEALRLAMDDLEARVTHVTALRDRLLEEIPAMFPDRCIITGHPTERLSNSASFAFRELSGNDLLIHLDIAGIAASSGSACRSGSPKPSAVLEAIGLGPEWTSGGIRFTLGRQSTGEQVDYLFAVMPDIVNDLTRLGHNLAAAAVQM